MTAAQVKSAIKKMKKYDLDKLNNLANQSGTALHTVTITEINNIFKIELKFDEKFQNLEYYEAEVINTMPYLFKKIGIQLQIDPKNGNGSVTYHYTHPNGATNVYGVGFIDGWKFKHNI